MNRPHSNRGKVGLLVSIRDVNEAHIANESKRVSIVDLKEPSNGSLGRVNFEVASEICNVLSTDSLKSIALGEVADGPYWPEISRTERISLLSQFQFAKVGLSRMAAHSNWVTKWQEYFRDLPVAIKRVAVAYADSDAAESPSMLSVAKSASAAGCSALLIDTYAKGQGSVFDLVSITQLKEVIALAKEQRLTVVLAGSLDESHWNGIDQLLPDYIAVRGAVCSGNRESTICLDKIEKLGTMLKVCN